ncbi:MAG TPA: biotin carboxylase N-terminal domain-containing protein [bacterium]|nr:biotin carboxylase N-terminal domain-containing protein [bacterium]
MAARPPDSNGGALRKVLVANRGEIALRVIRACRVSGLEAVAVYSDADRTAPHVAAADEAYRLGPAPAAESYLSVGAIVDAARRSGADAVHPGYGFLAENPALAAACAGAGLVFVGPPAAALARCGDKAETRRVVRAAGVPILPGTDPLDDAALAREAERIGFPVLLKAAFGGGGKGIHLVSRAADLAAAVRLARGEARGAFGDDRVYLERWLDRARHVEVQILADAAGAVVHLGERECSIQRRHQKVIEEAPSPALDAPLRDAMGRAAIAAARAVGYANAGTVEFVLSGRDFFFLEINARLQVEHPVTELVTGIDLARLQFAIAGGAALPFGQDDVAMRGHAIEGRISAEDPDAGFVPWVGRVGHVVLPGGPGVRVDAALIPGMDVTRFYDPMLAKVIAWGETRAEAIARLGEALRETIITGVPTTVPFLRWALAHPAFRDGTYTTRFVETEWNGRPRSAPDIAGPAAAALTHLTERGAPAAVPHAGRAWIEAARREGLS